MSATALVRYDAMRREVAECARIDEAAQLRDKAAALRLYAKQSKDRELQRWVSEIQLRATIKLGELSRKLPTAERARTDLHPSGGTQTKTDTLADAGISTSVAHRAEALTGRSDLDDESGLAVEALGVALETAEIYFKECREADAIPNHSELNGIVARTLDDRFGAPPNPRPHKKRDALTNAWTDWDVAVKALATLEVEMRDIVSHPLTTATGPQKALNRARLAWSRLGYWIELMEETHGNHPRTISESTTLGEPT